MAALDVTTTQTAQNAQGTQQNMPGADDNTVSSQSLAPGMMQLELDQKGQFLKQLYASESDDTAKSRNMQKFMARADSTGSDDGDEMHGKMGKAAAKMGLPHVSKSHVKQMMARVGGHPAHQQLTQQVKLAMQGQGPVPTGHQIAAAATKALNDTGGLASGPGGRASAGDDASGTPTTTDGSDTTDAQDPSAQGTDASSTQQAAAGATSTTDATGSGTNTATGTGTGTATGTGTDTSTNVSGVTLAPVSKPSGMSDADFQNTKNQIAGLISGKTNLSTVAGNVMGFVYTVMMQAQIDGNKDKKEVLNHTKMLNGMMTGLNNYVSGVLIPGQDALTNKVNGMSEKQKQSDASTVSVTLNGVAENMNTAYAPTDKTTGQIVPDFQYSAKDGGRKQVTQQSLTQYIQLTQQWQQSIQNNQQTQTNRFQEVDSNQTSGMNILNSLLKNTHDAVSAIVHNVQS